MSPFLLGAALGGAAMYFFDPDRGRRRRALVRDQAVRASYSAKDLVDKSKRDLSNRSSAVSHRVKSAFNWHSPSDDVLAERVRSKMGRYVGHPGAIEVSTASGHVTLSGSILFHERDDLIAGIERVPGVRSVTDDLTVYQTAEGISELQGGRDRPGELPEALQENWSPATRVIGSTAGTTLTLYGLARSHHLAGFVALATGVALLARSASNMSLKRFGGIDRERGIGVQKTIYIAAPIDEVFEYLANYDNYPRFMRNVLSVHTHPDGISHWKVSGPAGSVVEWDSTTTKLELNELIEWHTIEGGPVQHSGRLRIEPVDEGTRVHVQMTYSPPAGVLGHAVAKLLGSDPKTQLDEDLMRLKSALETGKAARDAAASKGAALA